MKIEKLISCRFPLLFMLLVFSASCSDEDISINDSDYWKDGEGTLEAFDVFIDFQGTNYKSSTEIHSYKASVENKVVEGTFEVYNFDAEGNDVSDAQGDILSISFEKNCIKARVVGIITSGSDPEYLGKYAVWTVLDDGSTVNESTDIRYPVSKETADYHKVGGLDLEWYNLKSYFSCNGKVKLNSEKCD